MIEFYLRYFTSSPSSVCKVAGKNTRFVVAQKKEDFFNGTRPDLSNERSGGLILYRKYYSSTQAH